MPKAPEHHQLQAAEYLAEDQLLSSNFSLDRSWCNPVGSEQVDPSQGLGQAYRTLYKGWEICPWVTQVIQIAEASDFKQYAKWILDIS